MEEYWERDGKSHDKYEGNAYITEEAKCKKGYYNGSSIYSCTYCGYKYTVGSQFRDHFVKVVVGNCPSLYTNQCRKKWETQPTQDST